VASGIGVDANALVALRARIASPKVMAVALGSGWVLVVARMGELRNGRLSELLGGDAAVVRVQAGDAREVRNQSRVGLLDDAFGHHC